MRIGLREWGLYSILARFWYNFVARRSVSRCLMDQHYVFFSDFRSWSAPSAISCATCLVWEACRSGWRCSRTPSTTVTRDAWRRRSSTCAPLQMKSPGKYYLTIYSVVIVDLVLTPNWELRFSISTYCEGTRNSIWCQQKVYRANFLNWVKV